MFLITHRSVTQILDAAVEVRSLAHQPSEIVGYGGVEVGTSARSRQLLEKLGAEPPRSDSACKTKFLY